MWTHETVWGAQMARGRSTPDAANHGPRSRGRGTWPFMTFNLPDAGERESCRIAQRLARLLLESMAADDCSMRQLARDSGVDVATVKSVVEGTYGPRLDTAVRLLVARGLPLSRLTGTEVVDLTRAEDPTLPQQRQSRSPRSTSA